MNWLAHVYLSEPDVECQLGNLLADLVKGRDRHGMSAGFLRGARCHQAIDAFTDYHPVVERSRHRINPEHGRFAGILVDVFYDYFLVRSWDRYCPEPLATFTSRLYAGIQSAAVALPPLAHYAVQRMIAEDRLTSYGTLAGITVTLQRISQRLAARLGRPFALENAASELTANAAGLAEDFAEFFPALQRHVAQWNAST